MARIQWEPLAIPDLGESALRAQAMAGTSIQSAFGGLTNLLGQWEGDRREDVMADITRQQLTFSDPEAYAAALANGQIDLQSEYLRPEDMMRVAGYQDTLATRRNTNQSFEQGKQRYAWEVDDRRRTQDERTAMRSAYEELLPALAAARATNDPAAVDAVLSSVAAKYQGISVDGMMRLSSSAADALQEGRSRESHDMSKDSHALSMERGQLGLETDRTTFSQQQSDRSETRNVEALQALVSGIASPEILADKSPGGGAEMALQTAIEGGNFTAREIASVARQLGVQPPANVLAAIEAEGTPSGTRPFAFEGGTGQGAVGDRNYNPGNVRDVGQFRGQPGYLGTDSRGFARFSSPEAGANVATNQLRLYMNGRSRNVPNGGIRTIDQIVSTWAPVGPENSAASVANYKRYVAQRLGVSTTAQLTEADIPRLAQALGEFENGRTQRGVLSADARWGPGNRQNAERLTTDATARIEGGGSLRVSPANPTAFINEATSVLGRTRHMLSRQGAAAGIDAAANYDQTQAINRLSNVAAADAVRPAKGNVPAGIFAAEGVSARRLADAVDQLKRDVGGNLTSDTALRILADAKATGPNYGGQVMGNVRAVGGGIRIDMVRAAQIGRSLGAEGGANLAENAVNVRQGQAQAQALATQFEQTLARYRTSAAADARRLGPGEVSAMTRGFGEQILAINAQIDALTQTGQRNARSFAGQREPAPRAPSNRYMAVAPVSRTAAPATPPAPTPEQLARARATRQAVVNRSFNPILGGLGPLINSFWDRRERTTR